MLHTPYCCEMMCMELFSYSFWGFWKLLFGMILLNNAMILFSYLYLLVWPCLIWITYVFMGCMVWSLSGGLRIINWVWCYVCVRMNVIRWVRYLNILFGKLIGFDETLFSKHDVMACILLAIYKFSCVPCWECFALLRTLGRIKYCVRFFRT